MCQRQIDEKSYLYLLRFVKIAKCTPGTEEYLGTPLNTKGSRIFQREFATL